MSHLLPENAHIPSLLKNVIYRVQHFILVQNYTGNILWNAA